MKNVVGEWISGNLRPRRISDADYLRWERELFDSERWQPRAVLRRCRSWATATRRRKWSFRLLAAVLLLLVLPMVVGAVATAQTMSTMPGSASSVNSALSWNGLRDTDGVPVASYVYAAPGDSIFHPKTTVMVFVLDLEYEGWSDIDDMSIWGIGWAMSFKWLNIFGVVLIRVSNKLTGQIVTPLVLIVCGTVGSLIVAYFAARGYYAKAVRQVVTMVGVAFIGPMFLAHPMADVMSSDGLLAQGRDLGVMVAAGLNGTDTNDPTRLVATMQTDLVDNFIRHPLQVWNFGHEIDTEPACRQAWSAAVVTGNENTVKNAMQSCGDSSAYSAANNPSLGQMGAGILLLVCGLPGLGFGVILAAMVIKSAVGVFWCQFKLIFGFAGGGLIYGPTQIFLVRSIVDGFIAAGEMALYVIFTGIYVLFMGDLFAVSGGQGMSVIIIGGIVEIIAIIQLRRLRASMKQARQWTSNRLGLAIQGAGGGGGGGGGGTAFGMGNAGKPMTTMGVLGNVSALNSSPLVAWAMLGTPNPISPLSRMNKKMAKIGAEVGLDRRFSGKHGAGVQGMLSRIQFGEAAKRAAKKYGGVKTALGQAEAVRAVMLKHGGSQADAYAALYANGLRKDSQKYHSIESWGEVESVAGGYIGVEKNTARVVAAVARVQDSTRLLAKGDRNMTPEIVAANIATMRALTRFNRDNHPGGVRLTGHPEVLGGPELAIAENYFSNPTSEKMEALKFLANHGANESWGNLRGNNRLVGHATAFGQDPAHPEIDQLTGLGAKRILGWSSNEFNKAVDDAAHGFWENPTYATQRELRKAAERLQTHEHLSSGTPVGSGISLTPPSAAEDVTGPRGYNNAMEPVRRMMARSEDPGRMDIS